MEKANTILGTRISDLLDQQGLSQRELAEKVFSSVTFPELTEHEQELLDYFLTSKTYGTTSRAADNTIRKYQSKLRSKSKFRFLWARLFPEPKYMEQHFSFFCRHKLLLPIGYLWRIIRAPFIRKDQIKAEMKALKKYDNKKV